MIVVIRRVRSTALKEGRIVNWTSTTVPLWQIDCESYRKAGGSFQLRDITTQEHRAFVEAFCIRYHHLVQHAETTATFTPAP